MAKKSPNTRAGAAAKKAVRRNPKAFIITVIAILLIIAIAFCVLYFGFPDVWDGIILSIIGDGSNDGSGGSGGDSTLVRGEGDLTVHYIDVGQGDSILIIFPDNKTMLIDGGDSSNSIASAITSTLDSYNITTLDYVLLSHSDADHSASLDNAIAHAQQVKTVYTPKIRSNDYEMGLSSDYIKVTTAAYNNFLKQAFAATYLDENNEEQPAQVIFTQDVIVIEDDAHTYKFTMYCRDDAYYRTMRNTSGWLNDVSPICVLEYNGTKTIFTGDANSSTSEYATSSAEKNFLNTMQANGISDADFDADVLKVGHHGSQGSSGEDFLDFIDCEYAVVCVGDNGGNNSSGEYDLYISQALDTQNANLIGFAGNGKYNHPHYLVAGDGQRLERSGVQEVYYTVLNGNIICTVDSEGTITFTCDRVASVQDGAVVFIPFEAQTSGNFANARLIFVCTIPTNSASSERAYIHR